MLVRQDLRKLATYARGEIYEIDDCSVQGMKSNDFCLESYVQFMVVGIHDLHFHFPVLLSILVAIRRGIKIVEDFKESRIA